MSQSVFHPTPSPLKTGLRVTITRGALMGNWGLLGREHPDFPGFWYVRLQGSEQATDLRLLAAGQLAVVIPTPPLA